jgi:hypothetical protein
VHLLRVLALLSCIEFSISTHRHVLGRLKARDKGGSPQQQQAHDPVQPAAGVQQRLQVRCVILSLCCTVYKGIKLSSRLPCWLQRGLTSDGNLSLRMSQSK